MKVYGVLLVILLLAAGFLIQAYFLENYPQPILFGDPGAYYIVGQKLQQALARLQEGESLGEVVGSVRGLLYFAGVGSLYGFIDVLKPHDIPFFRLVLAGFNTLSMAGVFLLGRRLSGGYLGGLAALVMAVIYPTFTVQTGRLFPDPITGCFFVWSAWFYLEGAHRESGKWMVVAGLFLTGALLVRSQLFNYFLILLPLALLLSAPKWWPERKRRRLAGALIAGCLPGALLWVGIVGVVGDDLETIESFGNFTFKQRYPYGFWQFFDSDGWMGPYRLGEEPYYQALEAAAQQDERLLGSYPRQLIFTAGYVASRPTESGLMFLDNIYRLYDRPANDYKWDYPFAYGLQVFYQKAILLLAVAGMAAFGSRNTATLGVFFVPVCLALLHGLSYPWPRFNQPAMPILIAAAGAFLFWAARHMRGVPKRHRTHLAMAAASSLVLFLSSGILQTSLPEASRIAGWSARLVLLAVPFLFAVLASEEHRRRRLLAGGAWLCLASVATAHTLRDRTWHEVRVTLASSTPGVEQEIALSAEAVARLRNASQAFLVFDLHIPDGDSRRLTLDVDGTELPGSELIPTMPRFGESTAAGGRDRRTYPQWWAIPLNRERLPSSAPVTYRVRLMSKGDTGVTLFGDRFRDQQRWHEGPSFGDWPNLAAVKLEYDGDYRLPVRRDLWSAGTKSYRFDAAGERHPASSVHRIRIITLQSNEGYLDWQSEPIPNQNHLALGFFAYSGGEGEAELLLQHRPVLRFPLGRQQDFDVEEPPYRLCYRAEPPRGGMPYGGYVLLTAPQEKGPGLPLGVRFRSGMSIERLFFSLDTRQNPKALEDLASRCRVPASFTRMNGAGRIVDATSNSYPKDTGRWSVKEVF